MRPLELVVNGFRSYAEETRFDWRGRRLVGVVGPIGSGKSSILDAIAYALYGRTPATSRDTRYLPRAIEGSGAAGGGCVSAEKSLSDASPAPATAAETRDRNCLRAQT